MTNEEKVLWEAYPKGFLTVAPLQHRKGWVVLCNHPTMPNLAIIVFQSKDKGECERWLNANKYRYCPLP